MRLTVYTDFSLRVLMFLALKGDGLATIASAKSQAASPRLSRSSTIWMHWRCSGRPYHRSAVFNRRTCTFDPYSL